MGKGNPHRHGARHHSDNHVDYRPANRFNAEPNRPQEQPPLKEQNVTIEDKTFKVQLRTNERGPFVKLIETHINHNRRNHLIVPKCGAASLAQAILAVLNDGPAAGAEPTETVTA